VLTKIYGVGMGSVGWYLIPFAVGNFLGPLLLGRFFDTLGRKPMIAGTYILSGVLLVITGVLFDNGTLTATTQTIAWCVIFFFASAGASAAYLTVSEIFPMGGPA
jgi:MFS family permease